MIDNRPSKKQRELLSFIDGFIKGNGYGPSYREIMRALDYRSVSTVAVHVDGLITKGMLDKKDNSARSLEVVGSSEKQWLQKEIARRANTLRVKEDATLRRELTILVEAAKILGLAVAHKSEV